ncbi:MAG: ribonuclease PH [Anaerolineaceae bacterium 4572_32.2]|nr:MAG: ribonuclease PH [Anaerolineaceae bacterium 4572_32.2]
MIRVDGREADELRKVTLTPDYVVYPEGSVLVTMGQTKVLCNVTIEETVPRWMRVQQVEGGWVTAEYSLLPRSTHRRTLRETSGLRGRTQETCIVDCDVIQADGGTRTAAVTGGYVALDIALGKLIRGGLLPPKVITTPIAAVSVGLVDGRPLLDLCYEEDSMAEADVNVVMNAAGEFIEVQGTAEGEPFSRVLLEELLDLAQDGIGELLLIQQAVLNKIA